MGFKLFLNDFFILILIIANAVVIFLTGFDSLILQYPWLNTFDNILTGLFFVELIVKLNAFGRKSYFKDAWNIFDFILVALALPSLVVFLFGIEIIDLDYLLALRTLRVFKFFRFIRFVPNINHIVNGIYRAMKASILIVLGFFIFNFTISLVTCFLFKELAPEFFDNPLISFYSTFKIFTVEGWYEIPDSIVENSGQVLTFFVRFYFIVILLIGGVFGLSLVNSIFVDAMVSGSSDAIENKLDALEKKMDNLLTTMEKNK